MSFAQVGFLVSRVLAVILAMMLSSSVPELLNLFLVGSRPDEYSQQFRYSALAMILLYAGLSALLWFRANRFVPQGDERGPRGAFGPADAQAVTLKLLAAYAAFSAVWSVTSVAPFPGNDSPGWSRGALLSAGLRLAIAAALFYAGVRSQPENSK